MLKETYKKNRRILNSIERDILNTEGLDTTQSLSWLSGIPIRVPDIHQNHHASSINL